MEAAIDGKLGDFTNEDIRNNCPEVSEATINRVFNKLKSEGKVKVVGSWRNAKWMKL